jgi:hypothetical protein
MHTFSEKALTALNEAGWSEDRQIDITPFVEMLEKEGNVVFPVVADFLRSFGGLELSWPHPTADSPSKLGWGERRVRLYILAPYDPGLVRIVPQFWLHREDELVLGVNLCSIGNCGDGIDLLMAESGKVYGSYGETKFDLGNSGEEMIEIYAHWHPIHNPLPQIEIDWDEVESRASGQNPNK